LPCDPRAVLRGGAALPVISRRPRMPRWFVYWTKRDNGPPRNRARQGHQVSFSGLALIRTLSTAYAHRGRDLYSRCEKSVTQLAHATEERNQTAMPRAVDQDERARTFLLLPICFQSAGLAWYCTLKYLEYMADPARFELTTSAFGGQHCSGSYRLERDQISSINLRLALALGSI
jgi:hypothetical protein